ncbi:MAG: type VI secretion system baseplate subunit TssF [Thermomonas sp.]|uniref:type VI secretion system baseplate subunit TssF n=1 Tax=Thermomonas sp. TaxID=1971895 RepID=UPI0039E3A6F4
MLDDLLPYYETELTYLRRLSKEFGARYPKIAARLQMEGEVCEDPHVERMIESFAFLTSRIHKKLDDEFPQITEALLSVLYPHFLRPVPSMSIAQLQLAPGTEISTMQELPRHSELLTRHVQGLPVRYRTAYPVEVWPLRIADARLEAAERSAFAVTGSDTVATLRLRIEATGQEPLSKLKIPRLRLYLDGESPLVHALHELLLNSAASITLRAPGDAAQVPPLRLAPDALQPVGFDDADALLDYDPRSFLGYRLIQEYFVLPEKFLFVDLLLPDLSRFGREMEVAIEFNAFGRPERLQRLEQAVCAETFRLFCTPVVNLFKQQGEPIRLSQERHEYQVIPDVRRPMGLEVYSVDWVRKFSRTPGGTDSVEFHPIHSVQHGLHDDGSGHFWFLQRRPSMLPNDDGSDVMMSLVDRDMNPRTPGVDTLSIGLTCTNRDLPSLLPFGGDDSMLHPEQGGVIASAQLLKKPSATWRAPMRQANQWRLISHLSLNHLSIVDGGREALLEILNLYNFADSGTLRKQIAGITEVSGHPSVTRVGRAPRQAFVRGTEIELTFDENQYVGSGVYLMACVLDHFFGLYCTANSYTRLSVRTRQREDWMVRFAPRSGSLPLT